MSTVSPATAKDADFVGREWVSDEINKWLETPGSSLFLLAGHKGPVNRQLQPVSIKSVVAMSRLPEAGFAKIS
jgi:hypothetical protein